MVDTSKPFAAAICLGRDWRTVADRLGTRLAGAEMLRTCLAIMASSVVNPLERNVVINPAHPDFDKVLPGTIRPFVFDRRPANP